MAITHAHPIVHTHDGGKVHRHHVTHSHDNGEVLTPPHAHEGEASPAPGEIQGQHHTHEGVPTNEASDEMLNRMYPTMGGPGPRGM
jgi:hypothetical protein